MIRLLVPGAVCVPVLGLLLAPVAAGLAAEAPFGIEKRIPWTTSRLAGSPEPPLPYTVEKTFTNLAWKAPIYVAAEPGTDALLLVQAGGEPERPSKVYRFRDDPDARDSELVFEVPRRLVYSLCFHPGYVTNGLVYLFSNGPTGAAARTNRISRFTVGRQAPRLPDRSSEVSILEWPSSGHDGGDMAFGADGMLYLTSGDGSSDSDALNSGQTMDDLLGNVLRIDVDRPSDGRPYSIPADNPFVRLAGARPEIWAYGLRNPWRMCIDLPSGQVWVGSNGQDLWETAHLVRAGENYGWSVYEGSHPFYLGRKRGPTPLVAPTIEHSHAAFRSLTGGVVYRGRQLPELDGVYVYGDYSTGRIWGMKHNGRRALWHRELADTTRQIAAFRVNHRGDLLVVDHAGGLYRIRPATESSRGSGAPFPKTLSQTGLFSSTKEHRVAPGVIPYSVNAPAWADGARVERFMAVPGGLKVEFDSGRGWNFPDGTALFQTLVLEPERSPVTQPIRVETRVLLRQQGEWAGYSYRWNAAQSDATLVSRDGAETEFARRIPPAVGASADSQRSRRLQTWHFPSRAECMTCHSRQANFVLGITGQQLNRDHAYPVAVGSTGSIVPTGSAGSAGLAASSPSARITDNQLRALDHIGFFKGRISQPPGSLPRMPDPYDERAELEPRARAYLHVNCAACHVEAGGGNSMMELGFGRTRDRMNLVGARPQHDAFGLANAMLVAPGAPERSVLVQRLSRRGPGQMPPLGSKRVDEQAVRLMRDWIASLKAEQSFVKEWKMADLLPLLDATASSPARTRSFAGGQAAFTNTGCAQCHRFGGSTGTVGPDLTGVGRRLSARDILESILEPSKVVSDDYASHDFELSDGESISGRIEREDNRRVWVRSLTAGAASIEVDKRKIRRRERSTLSPMPAGMANTLTETQLLDLLAYLMSDANPEDPRFR